MFNDKWEVSTLFYLTRDFVRISCDLFRNVNAINLWRGYWRTTYVHLKKAHTGFWLQRCPRPLLMTTRKLFSTPHLMLPLLRPSLPHVQWREGVQNDQKFSWLFFFLLWIYLVSHHVRNWNLAERHPYSELIIYLLFLRANGSALILGKWIQ